MFKTTSDLVRDQVFIGCPWKGFKVKYEKLIERFDKKYALCFQ